MNRLKFGIVSMSHTANDIKCWSLGTILAMGRPCTYLDLGSMVRASHSGAIMLALCCMVGDRATMLLLRLNRSIIDSTLYCKRERERERDRNTNRRKVLSCDKTRERDRVGNLGPPSNFASSSPSPTWEFSTLTPASYSHVLLIHLTVHCINCSTDLTRKKTPNRLVTFGSRLYKKLLQACISHLSMQAKVRCRHTKKSKRYTRLNTTEYSYSALILFLFCDWCVIEFLELCEGSVSVIS